MTDQQIASTAPAQGRRFRAYSAKHLDMLIARAGLDPADRLAVRAVATVLPFRTNDLRDRVAHRLGRRPRRPDLPARVPAGRTCCRADDIGPIADLLGPAGPARGRSRPAAHEVRMRLNPHPAGQLALNIPALDEEPLPGLQHKYPETVLFFPQQGQTCHAYCTYCFRWAQFVDEPDLKMATDDVGPLVAYLRAHPEVTSVLITGGDPMIMGEPVLRRYIEPLLDPALEHIESIRIGTKSLAYWPQRFVTDPDADATLRLFEEVAHGGQDAGPHGALLPSAGARAADGRGGGAPDPDAGAVIRTQAPLIRTINDDDRHLGRHVADAAADGHGPVLHVRGARHRPAGLLRGAAGPGGTRSSATPTASVSGLCRTVRGPSMSATPGKVCVDGVAEIAGRRCSCCT